MSIAVVQSVTEESAIIFQFDGSEFYSSGVLSNSDTPLTPTTDGNTIIAAFSIYGGQFNDPTEVMDPSGWEITGVTDDVGNTYTRVSGAAAVLNSGPNDDFQYASALSDIWVCFNAIGGATIISVAVTNPLGWPPYPEINPSDWYSDGLWILEVSGLTGDNSGAHITNGPLAGPPSDTIFSGSQAVLTSKGPVVDVSSEALYLLVPWPWPAGPYSPDAGFPSPWVQLGGPDNSFSFYQIASSGRLNPTVLTRSINPGSGYVYNTNSEWSAALFGLGTFVPPTVAQPLVFVQMPD